MGLEAVKNKVYAGNYKLTPEEKNEFQQVYNEVRLSNKKPIKQLDWNCSSCVSTAYTVVKNYWNKTEIPVSIPKASANVETVVIGDNKPDGKSPDSLHVKKPGRKPKK